MLPARNNSFLYKINAYLEAIWLRIFDDFNFKRSEINVIYVIRIINFTSVRYDVTGNTSVNPGAKEHVLWTKLTETSAEHVVWRNVWKLAWTKTVS